MARNGASSSRGTGCAAAWARESRKVAIPPAHPAASSGNAPWTLHARPTSTTPTIESETSRCRSAMRPCSSRLVRTNEAPSRWKEIVVSSTQIESDRSHGDAPNRSRARISVQSSELNRMRSWFRSSLYCTSPRRDTGPENRNVTSAGVNDSTRRSTPKTHPHSTAPRTPSAPSSSSQREPATEAGAGRGRCSTATSHR